MMITTQILPNCPLATQPEGDGQPADYSPPPSTTPRAHGASMAAGSAFSVVTTEHVVRMARLRARLAEQERQLRELSDELRRLRDGQETPERHRRAGWAAIKHSITDWLLCLVASGAL